MNLNRKNVVGKQQTNLAETKIFLESRLIITKTVFTIY